MARHGKKLDSVHWTPFLQNTPSLAAGTAAKTLVAAQHLPETLLRIRGEWACWLEGVQAGGAGIQVTAGVILVPEGTGATVLWSPFTDGDAPWIWADSATLAYEEYVVDVAYSVDLVSMRRVIDNKAMRRNRNQEIQLVVENTTNAGTAAFVNVQIAGRVLSGQS